MKKRIIAIILVSMLTSLLGVSGCSAKIHAEDLMKGVKAAQTDRVGDVTPEDSAVVTDFAVRLFQQSLKADESENVLISPLSVLYALGMTANGAKGETLAQMQEVFGLEAGELNQYLYSYSQMLSEDKKNTLNAANSIWIKDVESLTVEPDFLTANATWYDAGIYKAPFDESTRADINHWVHDHTDGMIDEILEKPIDRKVVMYLVNALAFDAQWEKIYEENQVHDGMFTTESGTVRNVKFMDSKEWEYLEDEDAAGFLKYYKGKKYAFAALLPDEGCSISEYAASLTGERLSQILNQPEQTKVLASMPKFESEYSVKMNDVLIGMGMNDAFDPATANFTALGHSKDGNIFIGRVLHKTYIAVDEKGTKAGAATAVEMKTESAMVEEEPKVVHLDRPFVYMLIDCENRVPIFIGTMLDIEEK